MRASRWAVLAAATILADCGPAPIRTDFDPEASFERLHRYAWTDSTLARRRQLEEMSPFLERQLRHSVDEVLVRRGFTADAGQPDFLVSVFVVGPSRGQRPWRLWASTRCFGDPHLTIAIGYPYGFSRRVPWYRYRDFYRWDPWGYACSYRLGFGYVWVPVYDRPGERLPGTLVIDMMDPVSKELLWRGWDEGALADRDTRTSADEIETIVTRLLADFPPRRGR